MKRYSLLLVAVTAILCCSCNQKELEYPDEGHRYHIEIRVAYDKFWYIHYDGATEWSSVWDADEYRMSFQSLMPQEPAGLRVVVYTGDNYVYEYFNLPTYGGIIDLAAGIYDLTLFNNDTECIIFNDIDKEVEATATTRQRSDNVYTGTPYSTAGDNARNMNPPDMLYAINGGHVYCNEENDYKVYEYHLVPVVYKYLVRYHFKAGLHHVSMARGAMCGMASAVYLTDGHNADDRANIVYDIDMDSGRFETDSNTGEGIIYIVVNSFGAPGSDNEYYSRADDTYRLTLETLLTNGNVLTFDCDITDQIRVQPRGGVIDVYGLEVKDKDAAEPTGAFEVEIDDWGPHKDVNIM